MKIIYFLKEITRLILSKILSTKSNNQLSSHTLVDGNQNQSPTIRHSKSPINITYNNYLENTTSLPKKDKYKQTKTNKQGQISKIEISIRTKSTFEAKPHSALAVLRAEEARKQDQVTKVEFIY